MANQEIFNEDHNEEEQLKEEIPLSGDFNIRRFSKEPETSEVNRVREELEADNRRIDIDFPEAKEVPVEIRQAEKSPGQKNTLIRRAVNRIKRWVGIGGMAGLGLGAFEGDAKGQNTNQLNGSEVSTNTVNAVEVPKYAPAFTPEQKNWGPGTNKNFWAEEAARKAETVKQEIARTNNQGVANNKVDKPKPADRPTEQAITYGSVSYGSAEYGGYARYNGSVYSSDYNPSKEDLKRAKKDGFMWSPSDNTYIRNPFKGSPKDWGK
ncbi:MAG TPA: hypothetical protein VJI33_03225 [Candidatus Paceibacterota bacterium]